MKKPVWFRPLDFITIGGGGVISLGILAYALVHGAEGAHVKEGLILLAVVGLCFIGIWGKFVYDRKRWLDQFKWYPTYGFMISAGGYKQLPVVGFTLEALIKKTIDGWAKYHPNAEAIVKSQVNWVWFDKTLDEKPHELTGKLCNGFAVSNSNSFMIDYDTGMEPLETTAFAHELGHIIHGHATGQWDQEEHHQFAAARGLA